ncbi:[4Fe-4S] proteins maturation [Serendipita sp. 398]|nr:[4Fe-4S] proteins maturation [Serendipita sp. 398]
MSLLFLPPTRRFFTVASRSSRSITTTRSQRPFRHQICKNYEIRGTRLASSLASEPVPSDIYAIKAKTPTLKDLEEVELDPENLIPEEEATFGITQSAAEQLRSISMRENDKGVALRVAVESGGCHGYQYKMELTSKYEPDDYLFQHATLGPSNVVIDTVSMGLLKGSTLDFATELIGSSFRVVDNPQSKGSGCGCGVSWEAKD